MSFESLGLSPFLRKAVAESQYVSATPVQEAAIPAIMSGADVKACAQTGSGKTAAFALPLLDGMVGISRRSVRTTRVLVLAPTRELAIQIGESFQRYSKFLPDPVKVSVVFGGVSVNPQMMELRGGTDILVATPGRLIDIVEKNAVKLDQVGTLVLDEADRLLDLGFTDELNAIMRMLPHKRQNLLFSATFPDEVTALSQSLLNNPVEIKIESEPELAPDIHQRAIEVDVPLRTQLLRRLIETNEWERVLVFVASTYSTDHVAEKLRKVGIKAASLHGKLSQGARTKALDGFKKSKIRVLICTDLASRGIDVNDLSVVVNYDLPRSATDYTHRIGRTGRAGKSGVAISFVSASTKAHFNLIEKRNDLSLTLEQVEGFEPTEEAAVHSGTGGVKGKRMSKKDKLRAAAARKEGKSWNSRPQEIVEEKKEVLKSLPKPRLQADPKGMRSSEPGAPEGLWK